jgi:Tfp pilus assembly protein PilO
MKNVTQKLKRFIRLNKLLAIYIGLFVIGLIALFIGIIPSIQKSIALVSELRSLQTEISRMQQKASMLSSFDQTSLETTVQDVLAAVPTDKSIHTLMSTVEAIALKNGLSIADLSIEGIGTLATGSAKVAAKPEGNVMSETIVLQGDLVPLRNFLADSVQVRRLLRIKRMELTAVPKSTAMNMKLVIEVFYSPLPTSISKVSDSIEPFSAKELATIQKLSSYPIVYQMTQPVQSLVGASGVREAPNVPVLTDPFSKPGSQTIPVVTVKPSPTMTVSPSVKPTISITPTARLTPSP